MKCIKPKVHSQTTFTWAKQEVYWQCFMMDRRANFTMWVVESISENYGGEECQRREALHFMCHLTQIFQYLKVGFSIFQKEKVKPYWLVKESLKNMKIYKTKNRGHVFWPYLRDLDEMENKCDPKFRRH